MWSFSFLLFWGCCGIYTWGMLTLPTLGSMTRHERPRRSSSSLDGNGCTDTTMCPAYATCTNTSRSYYCSCKRGFLSSNGLKTFKGPGVECKDIDECSQSPTPCGPNSICRNLPGRYRCSCMTGFSSPTGNNWIPGKRGHFTCRDVDECANPRSCPEHSTCHNSLGSYSCVCNPGFQSRSGRKSFQGLKEMCEDVDECASSRRCPEHSTCHNSVGSYSCACNTGYISRSGKKSFQGPGETCQDVDECANPRSCPEHSTCHNSVGNYSCACNPGYISRSGKKSFHGPGETCQDIDECSQKPPPCGPNSRCRNLPGRYECSCLTGFSSPTGNNWISGKPGHFTCTDINECLSHGVCPEHSECTNSLGSYRCSCKVGFTSGNSTCEDVDECANPRSCPEHSTCHNSVGSYSCACNSGYISRSGKKSFQGPGETCQDIDECSQKPPPCGPNSRCRNLPGRYECSCLTGFSSPTGNNWISGKPGHFTCTDINECLSHGVCPEHSECTNSLGSYHCSCKVGFTSGNSTCEDVDECANPRSCPEHSTCHNSLGSYSCVCKPGFQSRSGKKSFQGPGEMCQDIDECSQTPPTCGPNSSCRNLPGRYECSCLTGFSSPTGNNWIPGKSGHFTCTDVDECANPRSCPEHSTCHNSLGSYSCVCNPGFQSRSGKNFQGPGETCEDVDECSRNSTLCGPSSVCTNIPGKYSCSCLPGFFSPGVWSPEKPEAFKCADIDECLQDPSRCGPNSVCTNTLGSYSCGCIVGFHPNPEGSWEHGNFSCQRIPFKCKDDVIPSNMQVQLCHAGAPVEPKYVSFCALMNATLSILDNVCENKTTVVSLKMEFTLYLISHVGTIISLVCLAMAIITFLLCRTLRNQNTYIHLHLCICLFLAKMLFLTGVDKTDNQMGCALIAGFLHYLFLACFFWMLVEAVMLFLMVRNLKVVNYFSSRNIKMLYLCAFGYGLPGLVVAVSAGLQPQGYGMYNRCWLNTETGFIWSFLGPVCTIIVVNSILLTWTLCILRQKLSSVNAEVSTLKDTRLLTFKAFAQIFILGCSWVLGIFQIGPMANIMAYLFTIINSLQGAFIFLIHCVLSRQVREEYRRCTTRKTKPSSETQTSGILLSSVPSTSKTG
ncbi:adhesion G protein-coupled receptor E1 isoform X12 [Bos mutus]|uniref:adhesion G protein-coupled receptor E1 isoform X12 n=1 Tax=Bos mutus TaxID=72004 RepID=UPI0038B438B4